MVVEDVFEDWYGFGNIVENIFCFIFIFFLEVLNVVGIEGVWGLGKISFFNLILRNFVLKKDVYIYVLYIFFWLSGGSLVEVFFFLVVMVI